VNRARLGPLALALLLCPLCSISTAQAGGGPLGIDYRVTYDNSGIWNRTNQQIVLYGMMGTVGLGALWEGGAETFINKGTNGRWRDLLTAADCRAYEAKARAELGEACARWLETGELS